MKKVRIAPSLLSADFANLKGEIDKVDNADLLHIDVMDGHFVPNISIGALVVRAIRKETVLPLDIHLMIDSPKRYIRDFILAGGDLISVHIEATGEKASEVVQEVKRWGKKAGIAVNPSTPLSKIENVLEEADFVLLMSVEPGFPGQKFKREVLPKIKELRKRWKGDIEVDGGISRDNFKEVIQAGANILVAGSAIFKEREPARIVREMQDEGNKIWN